LQSIVLGDISGFAALAFISLSALMMAFRARLIKTFGGVESLKNAHVVVSVLALAFLTFHIGFLFNLPLTIPLDLGYGAFLLGAVLWATGVGFLERNKDSFFLHGSVATATVGLIVVHAASSGVNLPVLVAVPALLSAGALALLIGAYNLIKLGARKR
jgi:hypothetical protein